MGRARLMRLLAVVALVGAPAGAPPANALTPPPIDGTRLPAPGPAAPERPTVQREVCRVGSWGAGVVPTQFDALDLAAVGALTQGAGQRVAVIDSGVAAHRRLPGLVPGGDYVSTGDGTADCDSHGTLVAGIIAAAAEPASDRFRGVAPLATVIAIRQSSAHFGPIGEPPGVGDVDTLAKAVRTAADLGATVINISAVACRPEGSGLDDRALGAALAYAVEVRNVVIVAAAGNTDEGCSADQSVIVTPAWYDDYVLTVGSVDAHGAPSAFTRPSPWVDVAAPGEGVVSLSTVGDAMTDSVDGSAIAGTSFAAPVVSGLAALLRSRFPDWTPRQVMDRITATAHHPPGGRDDFVGAGVVDLLAAVSSDPSPTGRAASPPAPRPAPGPGPQSEPAPASTSGPAGMPTTQIGIGVLLAGLLVAVTGRAAVRREARHGSAAPDPD
ncbi:type VII secretion-associated serine protease mycosin [Mycolicibacter minnesotensis]